MDNEKGESECGLYREVMKSTNAPPADALAREFGFGIGCCISAKVCTPAGDMVDFAPLPPDVKREIARHVAAGWTQIRNDKTTDRERK